MDVFCTIFRRTRRIQIYPKNDFFKTPKKGAKPKIWLKMTLNDPYMTFEVKVDL